MLAIFQSWKLCRAPKANKLAKYYYNQNFIALPMIVTMKFLRSIRIGYRISLNNVPPWIMFPFEYFPFWKKLSMYIKKEHYSNFCTFEIASLVKEIRYLSTHFKQQFLSKNHSHVFTQGHNSLSHHRLIVRSVCNQSSITTFAKKFKRTFSTTELEIAQLYCLLSTCCELALKNVAH